MRCKEERPEKPKDGEKRYVHRYLYFPLTIDGETRWLEEVVYEVVWVACPYPEVAYGYEGSWCETRWVDGELEKYKRSKK